MLQFGLRLGRHPRCLVATTPRPTKLIRVAREGRDVVVTRGSTYENRENLAPGFFDQIIRKHVRLRVRFVLYRRHMFLVEVADGCA
jgi:phage terminase large subunit-like protein